MDTERFLTDEFDIDHPHLNENFYEVLDTMVEKRPAVHSKVGNGY